MELTVQPSTCGGSSFHIVSWIRARTLWHIVVPLHPSSSTLNKYLTRLKYIRCPRSYIYYIEHNHFAKYRFDKKIIVLWSIFNPRDTFYARKINFLFFFFFFFFLIYRSYASSIPSSLHRIICFRMYVKPWRRFSSTKRSVSKIIRVRDIFFFPSDTVPRYSQKSGL